MGKSSFQWHLGQLKDQHRQQQQDKTEATLMQKHQMLKIDTFCCFIYAYFCSSIIISVIPTIMMILFVFIFFQTATLIIFYWYMQLLITF